jgi:hypothetical protein
MSSGKKDTNYKSHVQLKDVVIDAWENPSNPAEWDDVMKFSQCDNVQVTGVTVNGGKEDCIDAVRGSNYSFTNMTLNPLNNGITIKGSIDGWNLKDILFTRKGKAYTIEIGQYDNYWTPWTKPTRNGTIDNVSMEDNSTVVVRIWDGEAPKQIINCKNLKVLKIPKIIWFPYFFFRSIQKDKTFIKKCIDKMRGKL